VRGLPLLEKEWVQRIGMGLETQVGWVVVGSNPLTFRASVRVTRDERGSGGCENPPSLHLSKGGVGETAGGGGQK
jgi:hypothetical protein